MNDNIKPQQDTKLSVKALLTLSFRNLLRHKIRSILLGIVIAFGVMILVVANSFTEGLKDIVINKIIVNWMGHINVSVIERSSATGNDKKEIIRDIDRLTAMVSAALPNIDFYREGVEVFSRFVGNKSSSLGIMIGLEAKHATPDWLNLIEGNAEDFSNKTYSYGILAYEGMMKQLNLKLYDVIKVKATTIYGKVQSAQLTVVGVMKSASTFQDMGVFVEMQDLKGLIEMKSNESGSIVVALKGINDPMAVVPWADKVFAALTPGIAGMYGKASASGKSVEATKLGVMTNRDTLAVFVSNATTLSGDLYLLSNTNGAALNKLLADKLGLRTGGTVHFEYRTKFGGESVKSSYKIVAVFDSPDMSEKPVVVLPNLMFYPEYCNFLPMEISAVTQAYYPATNSAIYHSFAKEWDMLPRTATSDEMMKKLEKYNKMKFKGIKLNVSSMYENAQMFIEIANVLNSVGFIAVMILFVIILVGVGNTLRMIIRERTREIGTVRAIGMRQNDVRRMINWEIAILSVFATVAGIILAFIVVLIIGSIPIKDPGDFSILLVDKKLYFVASLNVMVYLGILFLITYATAFFPSLNASLMPPTDALRGIMNKSNAK
ncbi:MAG: hypothetical protein A2Y33_09890 [Spirochaetes bacterium GWF1_51_8]|nr:MAG: hypothetical protein A2Y33_09890 [Spirochaetes bacterium GWF1_51_8]